MAKVIRRTVGTSVLVVAAAMAAAPGMAAEPIRVSSPVRATEFDTVPSRQYGVPDLAVDPENRLNVVATLPDLPNKRCGLMRSTDGGGEGGRVGRRDGEEVRGLRCAGRTQGEEVVGAAFESGGR